MERGKVNASVHTIYMIAKALGISFSELVRFLSPRADKKIEAEIAEILGSLRSLEKKKQAMFLSVTKGLISGIKRI